MKRPTRLISLNSGNTCAVVQPWVPFVQGYSVLVYPEEQGQPSAEQQDEMLVLALRIARELSQTKFGDSERYLLIHNGLGARRRRNFHYHIIPVAGRPQKTFVYLWLFLKNLLHGLWLLTRGLRRRLRKPNAS